MKKILNNEELKKKEYINNLRECINNLRDMQILSE